MSRDTQDTASYGKKVVYGIITLYDPPFQKIPLLSPSALRSPTTPKLPEQYRFGLVRVRSPLLTQSLLFSFPMGT